MSGKFGLGRGLDSLIPRGGPGIGEIPIASIQPNPHQPRHLVNPEELAGLAASIGEHGVIEPIVVARAEEGTGYVLIAGERRWNAAKQAGLTQIPAVIKDATPGQMLELALVENVQRSDLNPLEEAGAYQQLIAEFGLTQDEVARRVGRSRSTIANSVRLLGLPETVRTALASGEITEGHARALLGVADEDSRLAIYLGVIARGLNVRQTEKLIRRARVRPVLPFDRARSEDLTDASDLRQIEELFREALGTKVEVSRSGSGGRLVIYFYGDEQLQSIYESLTRP
jgi:ParB family chromosome partitioning protein